ELSTPFRRGRTGLVAALGRPGAYRVSCGDAVWEQTARESWLYVEVTLDESPRRLTIERLGDS
ncbi:MAG: hypothetical protein GX557_02410, partial [Chloroflexi bacterium]|nr:hypothetical protein [Chloroflexota bacterium]